MSGFSFSDNMLVGKQSRSRFILVVASWVVLAISMLAIASDLSKAFANSAPDMNVAGQSGTRGNIEVVETNTTVVDVATTDDSDSEGSGLTYELTNEAYVRDGVTLPEDNDDFSIDASTGLLSFNSPADFESPADSNADNVYTINIKVTDSGGLSDYFFLTITVKDTDETVPSLSLVAPANHTGQPFDVSVQANKSISHLNPQIGDVTIVNGTAVEVINGCYLCLRVTPASNAPVTITIPANTVADLITGQLVTNAAQAVVAYNVASPTTTSIVRQSASPTSNDTLTWRVTFSKQISVNGLGSAFSVTGTTAAVTVTFIDPLRDLGSPVAVEVVDVSISGGDLAGLEGNVVLNFDPVASGLKDYSGLAFVSSVPTGANETTYVVSQDTDAPSVQIQNAPASHDRATAFGITVEFSEDVTDFAADDIVAGNATVSNFTAVDGNTYTATITPAGGRDITISVPASVAKDLSGNDNMASTEVTIKSDIVEQTQKQAGAFIQSRSSTISNIQPNIGGFVDGTFNSGGGPLGNFGLRLNAAGFNTRFSTSLGRIWGEMARNQRQAESSLRNDRALPSQFKAQSAYIFGLESEEQNSNTNAKSDNPSRLIRSQSVGQQEGKEQIYASAHDLRESEQLSEAQRRGYDLWVQLYGARAKAGGSESTIWAGYVGAHKYFTPNLLIGGLIQLDWSDEENQSASTSSDGFGWMVGPYLAAKHPEQNLFFDARAAWGRSDNNLKTSSSTGEFGTERWMASAKLSGFFQHEAWSVRPSVSVAYFEETQESFIDSLGNTIGAQTFSSGELRFGPTVSHTINFDNGFTLQPKIGVNGVWNFHVQNGASSQGAVIGKDDLRARIDLGFAAIQAERWSLDISGFYDGIGIDDYYAYGGKARMTVPLQ